MYRCFGIGYQCHIGDTGADGERSAIALTAGVPIQSLLCPCSIAAQWLCGTRGGTAPPRKYWVHNGAAWPIVMRGGLMLRGMRRTRPL